MLTEPMHYPTKVLHYLMHISTSKMRNQYTYISGNFPTTLQSAGCLMEESKLTAGTRVMEWPMCRWKVTL